MDSKYRLKNLFLPLFAVALVAGCATSHIPEKSGFLPDYSRLQSVGAPAGGNRLVYASPDFTPSRYHAIKLDPVMYYPEPQANAEVSLETLTQIRKELDRTLRQKLGAKVQLVDSAGPGVAQVRIAITAIGAETRALKPYQFVPIALALTGAKAMAQGGLPRDATIAVESHVTDSVSGNLLYAAVRGGTGERVVDAAQGRGGVQLSSLQPMIEAWSTAVADGVQQYVKAK